MVAAVEYHEEVHRRGEECVQGVLDQVPAEVRQFATGWRSATDPDIEQKVRRQVCLEEGCNLIENTGLGELERSFRCSRCGETRKQPREEP